MRVFISWSGPLSEAVAEALDEFLSRVIQSLELFRSNRHILKGEPWLTRLNRELGGTNVGILVLTPDSLRSDWVLFEAGALAKGVEGSLVMPLLIGIAKSDVTGPLSHLQATVFEESDVRQMIEVINSTLVRPVHADVLASSFASNWPRFQKRVNLALEDAQNAQLEIVEPRGEREILEEVLEGVREIKRGEMIAATYIAGSAIPTSEGTYVVPATGITYGRPSQGEIWKVLGMVPTHPDDLTKPEEPNEDPPVSLREDSTDES